MHVDKTPMSSGRPRTRSQLDKHYAEIFKSKNKGGARASSGNLENGVGSESLGKRKRGLKKDDVVEVKNSEGGDVGEFEGRMTRSMRRASNGGGVENCSGSRAVVSEGKSAGASSGNLENGVGSESSGKRKPCLKKDDVVEVKNSEGGDVGEFEGRMTRSMRRASNGGGVGNCSGSRAVVSEGKSEVNGSKGNVGSGRVKKLGSGGSNKGKDQDKDVVLLSVEYLSPGGGSSRKRGGLRSGGSVSGNGDGNAKLEQGGLRKRGGLRSGSVSKNGDGNANLVQDGSRKGGGLRSGAVSGNRDGNANHLQDGSRKRGGLRSGSVSRNGDGNVNLEQDCVDVGIRSSSASHGANHSVGSRIAVMDDKNVGCVGSDGDIGMTGEVGKIVGSDMKTHLKTSHISDDDNDSVEYLGTDYEGEKDFGGCVEHLGTDYEGEKDFGRCSGSEAGNENDDPQCVDLDEIVNNTYVYDLSREHYESDESTDLEAMLGEVSSCDDDSDDKDYQAEKSSSSDDSGTSHYVNDNDDADYDSNGGGTSDIQGRKEHGFEQLKDNGNDKGSNEIERSNCHQEKEQIVINIDDSEKSSSDTERQRTVTEKTSGAVQHIDDVMEEPMKVLGRCVPNRVGTNNIWDRAKNDMSEGKSQKEEPCFELREDEGYNENQGSNSLHEKEQFVSKTDDSKKLSSHTKSTSTYTQKGCAEVREDEGYNENQGSNSLHEKEQFVSKTDDGKKLSSHTKSTSTYTQKDCAEVQEVDDSMGVAWKILRDDSNKSASERPQINTEEESENERDIYDMIDEANKVMRKKPRIPTEKESHDVRDIDDMMDDASKLPGSGNGSSRIGTEANKVMSKKPRIPTEKESHDVRDIDDMMDDASKLPGSGNGSSRIGTEGNKAMRKKPRIPTEKESHDVRDIDDMMDDASKLPGSGNGSSRIGTEANKVMSKKPRIPTEKESHDVRDIDDMMDDASKLPGSGNGSSRIGTEANKVMSKKPRIPTEKESHDVRDIDDMMDDASKLPGSGNGSSRIGTEGKQLSGLGIEIQFGASDQRRCVGPDQSHPSNRFKKEAAHGKVSPPPVKDINTQKERSADGVGKKRFRAPTKDEVIKMLVKSIDSMEDPVEKSAPVQEIPVKFRFDDGVDPPPEKTEYEKEMESLFHDMQLALGASEIDNDFANLSKPAVEDPVPEIDQTPEACCRRGEHDTVRDEQIGILCRHCGKIVLDIKHILPDWDTRRVTRQNRKDFGDSPDRVGDGLKFDSTSAPPGSFNCAEGTVWDLVPGVKEAMFPHQREAFEFMWKNIAGDVRLEKLTPLGDNGKGTGCIISHAPGTGKTRLTLVFLESFLKRYPTCRPMIIAPKGVLNVWKTEIKKWEASLVFHNLNNPEFTSSEIQMVKEKAGLVGIGGMNRDNARLVKMYSWILSGGILGMSYKTFANLAGESGAKPKTETEKLMWNKLVENPGLLVLDEGHVPRNAGSQMFKALRKVKTQRRILLSGTPFQNNFDELRNTLCLVDPKFLVLDKNDWKKVTTEGTDNLKKLRSMLDPLIHVHNGSLLQKDLPGLRYTVVSLRPSKLQGTILKTVEDKESNFMKRTYLLSLISIHPSTVLPENNMLFSSYKDKLEEIESDSDAGVKLKFVLNLTYLATEHGERVLIFSQYIPSLHFIKKHLEARHSWKEGREILYMDGGLYEKQRQESISSLNDASSNAKVLLASVKACSEGINLIGASRVVLLDTVWNPSVEKQAICRAYRYLQNRVVYVYRIIISGLEVRQCKLQARKEQISQRILDDGQSSQADASISPEISEDKVLEATVNLESCRDIFEKIIHQSKESSIWLDELEAANSPGS